MKTTIRTTPEADADLLDIAFYIAQDSFEASERLIDTFDEKFHMLARSPGVGRPREELAPGLRSFPVGKYVIFYRVVRRGIEIIRVLHAARDIPALF